MPPVTKGFGNTWVDFVTRKCYPGGGYPIKMKIRGLYEKRGWWYYRPPQVKGVRPPAVALRTRDRAEAIRLYEQLHRQTSRVHKGGKLQLEISRYLRSRLERGLHTEQTSRDTGYTLAKMHQFVGPGKMIGDCTTAVLQDWFAHLAKTNASTSLNSYRGAVSGFFSWAQKEGMIEENPAKALVLPKSVATRAEKYCTREERDKLVAEPLDREDIALILWLGFFAGMRIGEIVEARTDWIDLHGGVVHVRNTDTFTAKGKRARVVRMSTRLRGFLEGYMERWPDLPGAGERDYLLRPDKAAGKKRKSRTARPNKWRYDARLPMKRHVAARGLPWVSFHVMRHTFGTLHAMADTPLATIAREMGDDYKTTYDNYVGYSRHGGHSDVTD